jgi:leucyl aminopeptidase (aminopeptidase T)
MERVHKSEKLTLRRREMPEYYEYELGKAAKILCEDLFKLKPGETFVITADTESDERVIDATARAAFACDAKPMVIYTASPLGVGKAADPMLPVEALTAVLLKADAWVEFNNEWLLYSTPCDIAMKENKKLRHLCLVGMKADIMVRNIGRVDYQNLEKFMKLVTERTFSAKHMRITTPAGTDVEFDNDPSHESHMALGYADTPGTHMAAGQIAWSPNLESINGKIVFDGSLVPPIVGLLKEPVSLTIQKGEIVKFEGGKEAIEYEKWLKGFNHPQMLKLAHTAYGFNPGARLTGNVVEDERVWGVTEWGIGHVGPGLVPGGISGPSHSDGICLNSSVWLDGVQIMDKGQPLDPELKKLARELGK